MQTAQNTILVTGGGSGIGRGLAESFHRLGNQVIIAGRRREQLENVAAANPGMQLLTLDQSDAADIERFATEASQRHPDLNVLINNAGIQYSEDLTAGRVADAEAMIITNLLGPIRLTAALLPRSGHGTRRCERTLEFGCGLRRVLGPLRPFVVRLPTVLRGCPQMP